nr:protein HESO1-like isoform X1 [Ipomoea batatas]
MEKSSGLEELLHGVCLVLFPKPSDYDPRRDLIYIINEIVKEIYEFGSFPMDVFAANSDLDLSVNFSNRVTGRLRLSRSLQRSFIYFSVNSHDISRLALLISCLSATMNPLKVLLHSCSTTLGAS